MRVKDKFTSLLRITLAGLLFALSLHLLPISTPVTQSAYAIPNSTPADQPTDDTTTGNEENSEENPEEKPSENQDEDQNKDQDKEKEKVTGTNCTNQTGAIGWLICPTTGVIAGAIDAIYSIIENFLVIEPVAFNQESPLYTVWDYCRSITNIVFIILILITIYSQLTGLGFSNYNIKRTLPRIIIAAALVNLSFILCSLCLDLSNIFGANLRGFFTGIEETIMANTGFEAASYSLGNITNVVLAGGAIGGVTVAVIASGGIAAFFWMLVPVILGAFVSVVTGLVTISMRQAVVVLLVMIAPLAVVSYTLPNTEKWFEKWRKLFFQMLIFYPTFSFLFGASQLAGFVLVSSATNIYGIILGIAVQIFPLFFAWQLMKMSGTALGMINSKLNSLASKPTGTARGWADSHRALSRARHTATSKMPSARLNRWLEDNKARRDADTAEYKKRSAARSAANAYNPYNRNGQLTRRGEKLYAMQADTMRDSNRLKQYKAEFEEQGYDDNGTDRRVKKSSLKRIKAANEAIVREVDRSHMADSFLESAKTANAISYAKRTESNRNKITDIRTQLANNKITQAEADQQIAAVNGDMSNTLAAVANAEDRTKYMNNIFANAISAQAKADKALGDDYAQLYANTEYTAHIDADLHRSFKEKNYNSMESAIVQMAQRGDFNLIEQALRDHSGEIANDLNMQKHLADTLIKYKADSAPLWAYAKAINVRRAKHNVDPASVALFATYSEFEQGIPAAGDSDDSTARKLSLNALIKDISDPAVAVSQDRTTFAYLLESQYNNRLQPNDLGFQIKQLRSAASSGRMDGEQLGNLNALLTGGLIFNGKTGQLDTQKTKQAALDYVQNSQNKAAVIANIEDYVANMSAAQLASMKESTFVALNGALAYLKNDATDYGTGYPGGLSKTFYDAIYRNAANNMNNVIKSSMNTNIKNYLGIQNNKQ